MREAKAIAFTNENPAVEVRVPRGYKAVIQQGWI